MRPKHLIGLFAIALAAACEPAVAPTVPIDPSFAMGSPTDVINGSGDVIIADARRSFAFSARRFEDGSATGSFELHARQADVRVHGEMICATVIGSTAWMGGRITSQGPFQGSDAIWRVADLGAGLGLESGGYVKGFSDLISLLQPTAPGGAAAFCATTPPGPGLDFRVGGGITIHHPGSTSFTSVDVVELEDFPVFIPCAVGGAGELVLLDGSLQFLFHFSEDPAGGFHVTSEANPQDLSGLGQTTGDQYQGTGGTGSQTNFTVTGVPFTDSFVNNFRIIGEGPGNNFLVHVNAHVTVNANSDLIVDNVNLTVDCR